MTPLAAPIPTDILLRVLGLARQLAAPHDMSALLRLIIDAGRDVVGAQRGAVLLYDPALRQLHPAAERGSVRRYLAAPDSSPGGPQHRELTGGVSIDRGLAGACLRSRKIINVADVEDDPRFDAAIDAAPESGGQGLVSVPLVARQGDLVGVLQLGDAVRGRFADDDENMAEVVAGHAAAAIQHERLALERLQRLKMERDLAAARSIQDGVLPHTLPTPTGYSLAAFNRPAAQTGGDIYDLVRMGPTDAAPVAILLADASGHGIAPALSVVQVRAMLRMGLRLNASIPNLVCQIDRQLIEDLADDQFVTAFVGCLDPLRHRLTYHAAGQGPLLHYHAREDRAEWHGACALPLGISGHRGPRDLPQMVLEPGDYVVLLTDGFYECPDRAGEPFGEARVAQIVSDHRHKGAQAVLDALVRGIDGHAGNAEQADDLTGIVVHRQPLELPS